MNFPIVLHGDLRLAIFQRLKLLNQRLESYRLVVKKLTVHVDVVLT